jgi:cyclohexa-1,5-dienecarbonyl-CoA hydratase
MADIDTNTDDLQFLAEAPAAPRPLKYIQLDVSTSVARLTLNRPPYNVLTIDMMEEISRSIDGLRDRNDVRVILIKASPECKAFSAGVGIEDSRPERAFQMLEAFQGVFRAMMEISKPVITVVNGPAIGGGCELAALSDMIVATPKARFSQPEIKLGVFPPLAAVILPHVIGHKRAIEMILTGEPLEAEEARRLGLVNRIVPEANLDQEVEKLVNKITEQSAPVLEMAKKSIYETIGLTIPDAIKLSSNIYLNQLMDLDDAREGLRAMVEKRKPVWKNK